MKKQTSHRFCLLQILLLSLMPTESWATQSPDNSGNNKLDKVSLSLDDLETLIDGFEATIVKDRQGRSKKETSRAVIYGQVFPDCIQHLEPIAHDNPKDGKGNCTDTVGFEFLDSGGQFKKCVEGHHKKRETCETLKCTSLSDYNTKAFSFPLQDNYDNHVEFKHMFTNNLKDIRSKDRFQCEDFPDAPLIHESTKFKEMTKKKENTERADAEKAEQEALEAEKKEQKEKEHTENIEYLKKQICVNCKSQKELEDAIAANEKLRNMQEIGAQLGIITLNQGEFEKNKKQFQEAGLTLLLSEIASAPLEQLGGLSEKLVEWAKSHPKDAEKVATSGLKPLGERFANHPHANPTTYEAAAEIFEQARKLTSNSKYKAEFAKKLEDLKIQRIVSMAQYGLQRNPYDFTREYTHLIRETEQQAWRVCYGFQAKLEECAEVLKLRSVVRNLPQIAHAADVQGVQAQVGLQQALHPEQYGMSAGMPGVQYPVNPANPMAAVNPMVSGAYNPLPGTAHNPMATGAYNPMPGTAYNPMMTGAYNPMNPMGGSMMGGYPMHSMNPMMGGTYNPMPGSAYNSMNPMNPMMGGSMMGGHPMMNSMNPMMGGYPMNSMNPMMGGYPMNPMNPIPVH
ncbi:MAG: hypothetical protein ABI041_05910 [Bdellovibrionia bacterium]